MHGAAIDSGGIIADGNPGCDGEDFANDRATFWHVGKMSDRPHDFPGARNLLRQCARVGLRLENLVESRSVDDERCADRLERFGGESLPWTGGHDVEGPDAGVLEGFARISGRDRGDVVFQCALAVRVFLRGTRAEGPLSGRIEPTAGQAHAGPAAKRVPYEADAGLVDECGPFRIVEDLVEREGNVARAIP